MMKPMIEIDGAFGEGGGQVLRTALTLATLTGQPTHIRRIRANRRTPGLAPQHLTGVQALASICEAGLQGATLRSTEVVFRPQSRARPGHYRFDVTEAAQGGSAGSVTLVCQTTLLPLIFAADPSHLTLKGGTHVPWSPPFDYLVHVYLSTLAPMGVEASCQLAAWGFYPVGGGEFTVTIAGLERLPLKPLILLERGNLRRVQGVAVAGNLPSHIAQRMTDRASKVLRDAGLRVEIIPQRVRCKGAGAGLFLTAEYEHGLAGFSALGKKGKPSEVVADEACHDLLSHHASGAPVDKHLADQLLLPLALAEGRSQFRTAQISRHLLTNAHIIRQFIPARIEIEGAEGEPGTVVVEGVGFLPEK